MPTVIVIGDGPGGLSAALFLAKNKVDVVVFGEDKTAMNYALVKNYLGIAEILGTDFQKVARKQVTDMGARLREEHVDTVAAAARVQFTFDRAIDEHLERPVVEVDRVGHVQ